MAENERPNIFGSDWERTFDEGPFALRGTNVGAGAAEIGMSVYEVDSGKRNIPYHAHHGVEETIVVLDGEPTIRTPDGETQLAKGDVHCFGKGSASAHQVINKSDKTIRFLLISSKADADFIEYPDSAKLQLMGGEFGSPTAFRTIVSAEGQLGYFDGELG